MKQHHQLLQSPSGVALLRRINTTLLFFFLGLIIGLLSGITFICLYVVKSVSNDRGFELPRLKDEKKNN